MFYHWSIFIGLLFSLSTVWSQNSHGPSSNRQKRDQSVERKNEFSTPQLYQTILERCNRVEEFRYLKSAGEKLGMKIYLFGGTAAAFAHYVS